MPISLSMAAVQPEPQKMTAVLVVAADAHPGRSLRASSRSRVVCSPVALASVWVLAYRGRTSSRMKSSMKDSARPDAV